MEEKYKQVSYPLNNDKGIYAFPFILFTCKSNETKS